MCEIQEGVDVSQAFGCDLCGFRSPDKDAVVRHQHKSHPVERRRNKEVIVCHLCKDTYSGVNNSIQSHLVAEHKFHACGVHCPFEGCERVFCGKGGLATHLVQRRVGHAVDKEEAKKISEEELAKVFPATVDGETTKVVRQWKDWMCVCRGFKAELERRDRENGFLVNRKQYFLRHIRTCKDFQRYKRIAPGKCTERYGSALDGYACPHCEGLPPFSEPSALSSHIRRVHQAKDVECPVCKKLVREHNLGSHLRDHDPDVTFPCTVEGCKVAPFNTRSALQSHVARFHSDPIPCGMTVDPETGLEVASDDPKGVLCTYESYDRGRIWEHRKRCHANKIYKCEIPHCGSAFGSKLALKTHMKESHTPKYPCFLCDVMTVTVPELRDHMRTHDVARTPCSCGETFFPGDHYDHHVECCKKGAEEVIKCKTCRLHRMMCRSAKHRGSDGEVAIAEVLTLLRIPYEKEASVSKSIIYGNPSMKGKHHYDFKLTMKDTTVFVEYDGVYHFRPIAGFLKFVGQVHRDLAKSRYAVQAENTHIIRVTGDDADTDVVCRLADLRLRWTREDGTTGSRSDILKFLGTYSPGKFKPRLHSFVSTDALTMSDGKPNILRRSFRKCVPETEVTLECVTKVVQTMSDCPKALLVDDEGSDHHDSKVLAERRRIQNYFFAKKEAVALIFLRENRTAPKDFMESDELRTVAVICHNMPEFAHLLLPSKHQQKQKREPPLERPCESSSTPPPTPPSTPPPPTPSSTPPPPTPPSPTHPSKRRKLDIECT